MYVYIDIDMGKAINRKKPFKPKPFNLIQPKNLKSKSVNSAVVKHNQVKVKVPKLSIIYLNDIDNSEKSKYDDIITIDIFPTKQSQTKDEINKKYTEHYNNIKKLHPLGTKQYLRSDNNFYNGQDFINAVIFFNNFYCNKKCGASNCTGPLSEYKKLPVCVKTVKKSKRGLTEVEQNNMITTYIIERKFKIVFLQNKNNGVISGYNIQILLIKKERVTPLTKLQSHILRTLAVDDADIIVNNVNNLNCRWLDLFIILFLLLDKVHDCDGRVTTTCNSMEPVNNMMQTIWGNIIVIIVKLNTILDKKKINQLYLFNALQILLKHAMIQYKYKSLKISGYEDLICAVFINCLFYYKVNQQAINVVDSQINNNNLFVHNNASPIYGGTQTVSASIATDGGASVNKENQTRYVCSNINVAIGSFKYTTNITPSTNNGQPINSIHPTAVFSVGAEPNNSTIITTSNGTITIDDDSGNNYTETIEYNTIKQEYKTDLLYKKHNSAVFISEVSKGINNIDPSVSAYCDSVNDITNLSVNDAIFNRAIASSVKLFEKTLCDFGITMGIIGKKVIETTYPSDSIRIKKNTPNTHSVNCANDRLAILLHMILLQFAPNIFPDLTFAYVTCPAQQCVYSNSTGFQTQFGEFNNTIFVNERMKEIIQESLTRVTDANGATVGGGNTIDEIIENDENRNLLVDILIFIEIIKNNYKYIKTKNENLMDVGEYVTIKEKILIYINNSSNDSQDAEKDDNDEEDNNTNLEYATINNDGIEYNDSQDAKINEDPEVNEELEVEELEVEELEVEELDDPKDSEDSEDNYIITSGGDDIDDLLQTTIENLAKDIVIDDTTSGNTIGYAGLFISIMMPGPESEDENIVNEDKIQKIFMLNNTTGNVHINSNINVDETKNLSKKNMGVKSGRIRTGPFTGLFTGLVPGQGGGKNRTHRRTKNKRTKRTKITKKKHLKNAVTSRKVKRNGKKRIRKITRKKKTTRKR